MSKEQAIEKLRNHLLVCISQTAPPDVPGFPLIATFLPSKLSAAVPRSWECARAPKRFAGS